MNPEEEKPKDDGDATPEPRAEESAAAEPQIENLEPPRDEAQVANSSDIEADEPTLESPLLPESAQIDESEPPPGEVSEPPSEPEAYAEPEPSPPVYAQPAPPAVAGSPPRVHEAAAEQLHEEPLAEIERTYESSHTREPEPQRSVFEEAEYLFGEPEIPMPEPPSRPGDRQRRRDAKRNLDLDLGRIKRRKRYGLFITSISVLFIAFVVAPVTWALVYLFVEPPSTVLMMQRAAEGQTIRHYPVPLNRMSPHIVRAVIAAEDANFCTHDGFDIEAIQDAIESNRRGRSLRGGSTISQQTAKNLFLWPDRGWVRKGFETYFTALIEFMWPKRRIMEAYLNNIEWGDGNFGIEAAARARFGVSAADLTPLQAARLAAVLPSPNRWRADNPGPYVRGRSATIVARARNVRTSGAASCALAMDRPAAG
ncbi:MAG: monofunctional biosynthetic peptidoglycan transglycosylase [Hyphomonadaceae bacterium]|nr:monofunctional biosynthetic peptidoglycan transglycosylase [Hyphomonadaceae bacterium]